MLRRAIKRQLISTSDNKEPKGNVLTHKKKRIRALGDKSRKDDAEKTLEKIVLGGEEEILQHLGEAANLKGDSGNHRKTTKRSKKDEPKPVWEDEDDFDSIVKSKQEPDQVVPTKKGQVKKVSGKQYGQKLKHHYEQITGQPSWALMKWQRDEQRKEDDSDTEESELLQSTGNYLEKSESLPKGFIQMKRCTDANKDKPSKGRLTSVEFHPTAQVILTAGIDQTLTLFQVDGKNNPKIQSIFMETFPVFNARFTADGNQVVMGSKHKSFYYYDMMAGKTVCVPKILGLEETSMKRFKMSPDGKFIVFMGSWGNIHLISAQSKEWIQTLKMNGSVEDVTFTQDGSRMYSHGDDGEVYVWDMRTRDCIHRFTDDGCMKGTTINMSRNGQFLACGSYSGVVNIYDDSHMNSRTPTPLKAVMNLTTPCTDLASNATSEVLAMSSNHAERAIRLMHLPSLTVFSNYPDKVDHLRIPTCTDFSLNSGYFAMGNHKGEALLYRVKHYGNY